MADGKPPIVEPSQKAVVPAKPPVVAPAKKLPPVVAAAAKVLPPVVAQAVKTPVTPVVPIVKPKIKALREKRKKLAADLAALRVLLEARYKAGAQPVFYRYVRAPDILPEIRDEDSRVVRERTEIPDGPKGGACLMIVVMSNELIHFTYSIHHPDDELNFIKDEARRLCQERFLKGEFLAIRYPDKAWSIVDNVLEAVNFYFAKQSVSPVLVLPNTIKAGKELEDFRNSLRTLRDFLRKYYNPER